MHMVETKRRERLILESALALQMMPIHSFIVISVWMCPKYMYNNIVNQSCALASFVFPKSTSLVYYWPAHRWIHNSINKRAARNETWGTVAFLRKGEYGL